MIEKPWQQKIDKNMIISICYHKNQAAGYYSLYYSAGYVTSPKKPHSNSLFVVEEFTNCHGIQYQIGRNKKSRVNPYENPPQ